MLEKSYPVGRISPPDYDDGMVVLKDEGRHELCFHVFYFGIF